MTITESKRKFDPETGNFFTKNTTILYKEDFAKFQSALKGVLEFIETGVVPDDSLFEQNDSYSDSNKTTEE